MVTEKDLKHISGIVKVILQASERARNSDSFLYLRVLEFYACTKGIDLRNMTVPHFLMNMQDYGLPKFETVRRARQKAQEQHPELAANDKVQENRMAIEREFRAFAVKN
ncbi:MAG: hypothetical protein J6V25_11675 [Oscillospiraceae bacterium]|nr:hypothetical protein [Oscillospiraceae bacterium]